MVDKTEKNQSNKKQKIFYYIAISANIIIYLGFVWATAEAGGGTGIVIALLLLAFVWSETAKYGGKIFKVITPQRDYLKRSRLSLYLSEWVLTLLISIGGYILLSFFVVTELFGIKIN